MTGDFYLAFVGDGDINHFIEPDLEIHKFKHYERKITEDLKGDMCLISQSHSI